MAEPEMVFGIPFMKTLNGVLVVWLLDFLHCW